MLLELAGGAARIKDLALKIGRSQAECSRQLNALIEDELVIKNGSLYTLSDQMFRFWIRAVYRHRDLSLAVDAPSRAFLFIKDLEAELNAFLDSDALSDADRVKKLFTAFAGDRVEWEGKSRQLPVMNRIEVQTREAGVFRIAASGSRSSWEVRAFSRPVTESDIRTFLADTKTARASKPRALLIYLDGMDPNAKLLAKNLNIWIIGLKNLNYLLDLHRLHKHVRLPHDRPEPSVLVPAVPVGA